MAVCSITKSISITIVILIVNLSIWTKSLLDPLIEGSVHESHRPRQSVFDRNWTLRLRPQVLLVTPGLRGPLGKNTLNRILLKIFDDDSLKKGQTFPALVIVVTTGI